MTTPPAYVYLAKLHNYMSADEWYFVGAADAPLKAVKDVHNSVINRAGVTRRVLWCVQCQDAKGVAQKINDYLRTEPRQAAGVDVVTYRLNGKEDVETLLEMAKKFAAQDRIRL